ncbi:putative pentatricopeptide repeat-containing protein At3g47840 [Neltuma alba]|uniref:putative pentatricopeptide repeat-containing protein At3g47840 n=1 Tax=Neltuma alba TaxID=207710 RepID=UPI0010A5124C|nr:putative pentatricopeptide repeat-containing protein At3g47840 [Prosopis alba]
MCGLIGYLGYNFDRERRYFLGVLFNGFGRWLHCGHASSAFAVAPSFSPATDRLQLSENVDGSAKSMYQGAGTKCRDPVWQIKPQQLASTVYSIHNLNMLELNSELKHLVKRGHLVEARDLFDKMPHRDEISWTTIIAGYVTASDSDGALVLYSNMWIQPGLQMDQFVISVVLKACAASMNRYYGELLHGYAVKSGLKNSVFVGSAVLDMYMKVGQIVLGCRVFEEMTVRNVISWTAIIVGLAHAGHSREALLYFSEMWKSKVGYDSYAFAIALKASADAGSLLDGKAIHAQTIKQGFDENSYVLNTLATMYNKCGKPDCGFRLFERMNVLNVVSWTTIITAYVQRGQEEHAVGAFKRMRILDVSPNEYTLSAIISACANLAVIEWGEQLHAYALRLGLADALSVANSIMTMYSICGHLTSASLVFHGMPRKDIVSWSTIISVYSQGGYGREAFEYLSWMRREGPKPNEFALASVLSVCGSMALLEQGRQVHAHVLCIGVDHEVMILSALINMYSKCGNLQEASKIFYGTKTNDIISWTAMINGYADHGYSQEAINLFEKISSNGLKPDAVTFIGVLTACSHAGLVDLGFYYFNLMGDEYQINPSKEHYGCMIDLLCRAGRLSEAELMIRSMPFQGDDVVWSTLLRACRIHGDVDCGRRAAEEILHLDPNSAGTHITLANIYAAKGIWNEVAQIRKVMRSKGLIKEPGWSWIEVNDQVNAFVAGDQSHPQSEHILTIMDILSSTREYNSLEICSLLDVED